MSNKTKKPRVGSKMPIWWKPEGARVLKVTKYIGYYPEFFKWNVRLEADTPKGWREICL